MFFCIKYAQHNRLTTTEQKRIDITKRLAPYSWTLLCRFLNYLNIQYYSLEILSFDQKLNEIVIYHAVCIHCKELNVAQNVAQKGIFL